MQHRNSRRFRILGYLFLSVPMGLLVILGAGEGFSGIVGGLAHVLQLVPLAAAGWTAYHYPKTAGILLTGAGLFLGTLYPFTAGGLSAEGTILTECILFVPVLVSGCCFWASGDAIGNGRTNR